MSPTSLTHMTIPSSLTHLRSLMPPVPKANHFAETAEFRLVEGDVRAARCAPRFGKPRGSSPAAKLGLRYQNRVGRQLAQHTASGRFMRMEATPWFSYADVFGSGICSPDFLLWPHDPSSDVVYVVEVKLTWVIAAACKLTDLYLPVVSAALGARASPLVICRNLTTASPHASHSLRDALASPARLLHWPDTGRLLW